MVHWIECQPGFWLPRSIECYQFPLYDDWNPDLPDWTEIVNLAGVGRPPSWAWGAWYTAQKADRPLKIDPGLAHAIAVRSYDSQRFVHIIPAWRRQLIEYVTAVDDIEDQVSTIAWLAETVLNKVIPIPRGVLSNVTQLRKMLDQLESTLSIVPLSRTSKSEYASKQRELRAAKRTARGNLARLASWLRENWGNLLEAGQASNTWFDVGIVLGPIMGYIEGGIWDLASRTIDNYVVAADALLPGFRDDYYASWAEWQQAIDDAWDATFENIEQWGTQSFTNGGGAFDPYQEFTP